MAWLSTRENDIAFLFPSWLLPQIPLMDIQDFLSTHGARVTGSAADAKPGPSWGARGTLEILRGGGNGVVDAHGARVG